MGLQRATGGTFLKLLSVELQVFQTVAMPPDRDLSRRAPRLFDMPMWGFGGIRQGFGALNRCFVEPVRDRFEVPKG